MPRMRTEVQLGGEWIDITDRVYDRDPVEIAAGRRDWGAHTDPTTARLTLNNRDGFLSPRNPMSPYYGLLTRNTPLRVSCRARTPTSCSTATPTGSRPRPTPRRSPSPATSTCAPKSRSIGTPPTRTKR